MEIPLQAAGAPLSRGFKVGLDVSKVKIIPESMIVMENECKNIRS
jgi:hypothetical protein